MQSQAYHLTAWGYGRDLVRNWKINGRYGPFIRPWHDSDIVIRGVELLVWPSVCSYQWFMVGNNTVPDIMLMASGEQRRVANFGLDFLFLHGDDNAYLDLHCRAVGYASVFLNFYYEPSYA
jgi:hypothetical protein